jgi:meso-butanediol dehydrogenase/(S,S)-butanediol dehydrogenase/diacetyl reductase
VAPGEARLRRPAQAAAGLRVAHPPGVRGEGGRTSAATVDPAGSVVLVTGGGSGIGLAITRAITDAGATVAVTGRRRDRPEQALAGVPAERAAVLPADLTDGAPVRQVAADVADRFGRLGVMSNAAGYGTAPLTDLADDAFSHLAEAALPHLALSRGDLVAVSSVSGLRGYWGQAAYNATKAAVTDVVRSLARDRGARGVRLNAVALALTSTLTGLTEGVGRDEASPAPFVDRIALGRPGEPEDVVPAVLFLASEGARYVTGAVLPVDGGTSASTGQQHL